MMQDKDLTDDVLDEIIAGAKTSMEQYLALSLKAERAANRQPNLKQNIPENIPTLRDGLAAIRSLGEIDSGKIQAERDSLNSPAIPDGFEDRNNKIAYDILGFGRLVVSGNSSGDLDLEIREFSFDRGSAPTPLKNLKPKYAVQAIVNRLQSYCDAMSCDDLEDIRDIPSQQQREGE